MDRTVLLKEATELLTLQLGKHPQPCVAEASVILGTLQDRLFQHSTEVVGMAVHEYMQRFQEQFVAPAATRISKCKTSQDKVISMAKFLRGKLAKAPAHKQPLHTQYLPTALRDTGKRQLDCLGIATAVLALCHHIAAQHPQQHGYLATAQMVVSDDHCWLALPAADQPATRTAGETSTDPVAPAQQQMVHIEVTDPGVLTPTQLAGSWLYAGGHGTTCSTAQVVMVLVAGLMPEELSNESAADELRVVQLSLLGQLAAKHPEALVYSNYFRWGMLQEETELQQLAAAAEAAAATGNMASLQAMALLPADSERLRSQLLYAKSMKCSSGWQWHPSSCAAFGWLNRMQAALCGETDNLLCLTQPPHSQQQQQQQDGIAGVKQWLDIAVFMLQQALQAVAGCTAVLRQYSGCAGKPNKAADTQLMEAVRDLWQNLADASKAVAYLQQLQEWEAAQQQLQGLPAQQPQPQPQLRMDVVAQVQSAPAAGGELQLAAQCSPETTEQQLQQQQTVVDAGVQPSPGGHLGCDVPATAAVPGHTVHLAAAIKAAAAAGQPVYSMQGAITLRDVISTSSWLQAQLEFLDSLLSFFGEDSADVPAGIVSDFIAVAGTYSSAARQQAVADAVSQAVVYSSRVQNLAGSRAWLHLEAVLQQQLQMPGTRSRKRQRKD